MSLDQAILMQRLYEQNKKMRAALEMGIQLCESGGHGAGESCPTCHFMRVAQEALEQKVENE